MDQIKFLKKEDYDKFKDSVKSIRAFNKKYFNPDTRSAVVILNDVLKKLSKKVGDKK